jgi:ABC-type long-subunit fatty acid transport system fused permease/ATPase subunit
MDPETSEGITTSSEEGKGITVTIPEETKQRMMDALKKLLCPPKPTTKQLFGMLINEILIFTLNGVICSVIANYFVSSLSFKWFLAFLLTYLATATPRCHLTRFANKQVYPHFR